MERTFCEYAARLGLDPYALDPEVGRKLEDLVVRLPASIRQDFFDSADPARLSEQADPLIAFFRSAEVQDLENVRKHIPRADRELMASLPAWRQGYEYARFLRDEMGLNGHGYSNVDQILASLRVDSGKVSITAWPTEQMDAVTGLSARQAPVFSLSGQRTESRKFAFCRSLGEYLQDPGVPTPDLNPTLGFTAPEEEPGFCGRVLGSRATNLGLFTHADVTDEDCEDMGRQFGVSSWVIQRQVANIAWRNMSVRPFGDRQRTLRVNRVPAAAPRENRPSRLR